MSELSFEERLSKLEDKQERMDELVTEHDKILVRGNGKPSIQEDVRNLVLFSTSIKFWMTTIAVTFLAQFVAVGVGLVITVLQIAPAVQHILKDLP